MKLGHFTTRARLASPSLLLISTSTETHGGGEDTKLPEKVLVEGLRSVVYGLVYTIYIYERRLGCTYT